MINYLQRHIWHEFFKNEFNIYLMLIAFYSIYTALPKKGLKAGLKVQRSILNGKLDLKWVYRDTALSLPI